MTREEAIRAIRGFIGQLTDGCQEAIISAIPELAESEDERIIEMIIDCLNRAVDAKYITLADRGKCLAWLEKQKEKSLIPDELVEGYKKCGLSELVEGAKFVNAINSINEQKEQKKESLRDFIDDFPYSAEQEEQKPIKMEVYEIGKGTTICGQDYKCKKDYKEGNCWYIKDAIYHCSRDGYLKDQNGVSWTCPPEWFNEYIQSNTEWAEEEKTRFVSGQFLQCKRSFDEFKEGEHYWLEYVGDDMYVGRSDNILNQRFHITPRQLYTLFSQKLEEVQGPPQEEKQVSLNYEPPFDENPSDKEIIEALIHHLNEQNGFLTAINCVSTKAILSWLKKQKEQKPAEWSKDYDEENIQTRFAFYTYKDDPSTLYLSNVFVEEASRNHGFGTRILRAAEKVAETIGATTISLKVKQDSPANAWYRKNGYGYVVFEDGYDWLEKNLEYMKPNYNNLPIEQQMEAAMIAIKGEISSKSQEWSEEDENLDEAARDYGVRGNANGVGGEDYANDLAIAFKAGAQWMKEQLTVK